MNNKASISRWLVAAAMGTLLACPSARAEDGVTAQQLLIGQSITLQGGKNDYGTAVLDGVQTYLTQVNRQGGVAGRKLVVKVLDDDNKSAQAEVNARQLVTQDKVFIVFGSIEGGPSNAVMKVTNELKVPFFGPMAGSPTFRAPHQPLVFPVRAEHKEEFRALLEYAKSLGMTRAAFIRSDSAVGQEHLANVRKIVQSLGLELVADLDFVSAHLDALIEKRVPGAARRSPASIASGARGGGGPSAPRRSMRSSAGRWRSQRMLEPCESWSISATLQPDQA